MGSTWDRMALVVSLLTVAAAALVGYLIYENIPHLEDEFAYLWQARVMADGKLSLPSPKFPKSFLIPFVIDFQGQRFGKYPPGWPAALSLGARLGIVHLVNPLLAGLAAWLTYRVGQRSLGEKPALLGSVLLATSPLFLIQAGSLLSHIWSLVLVLIFLLSWMDILEEQGSVPTWMPILAGGLSLGTLGLTRPLTALAVSLPFAGQGLILLIRGPSWKRKRVIGIGAITLIILIFYFVWQYAVTGDFFTNPYTLWWPYDRFGFGEGYGVTEAGHSLIQGWRNSRFSLKVAASDLFGWLGSSWIFIPFGLWAARTRKLVYHGGGIALSLVLFYLGYWVSSWVLGPRYYLEALPGIALLSAAGIFWLAGNDQPHREFGTIWRKFRALGMRVTLLLLIFSNLYYYLPLRLSGLHGLYGIERAHLAVFENPELEEYQPALVIVDSDRWMPYGNTLLLESPNLDSPLIFAWSIGPNTDRNLAEHYQGEREILYYYPDQDLDRLYSYPRPGSLIE